MLKLRYLVSICNFRDFENLLIKNMFICETSVSSLQERLLRKTYLTPENASKQQRKQKCSKKGSKQQQFLVQKKCSGSSWKNLGGRNKTTELIKSGLFYLLWEATCRMERKMSCLWEVGSSDVVTESVLYCRSYPGKNRKICSDQWVQRQSS